MRQRLSILIFFLIIVGVLVALNAFSYSASERTLDSEDAPKRSTSNAGASGTKELFDFLNEGGYPVSRWRDPISFLGKSDVGLPSTFVIVGPTVSPIRTRDSEQILTWVANGNTLVLIDRSPDAKLASPRTDWQMSVLPSEVSPRIQSGNVSALMAGAEAAHPSQPTSLTKNVKSVAPSILASTIHFKVIDPDADKKSITIKTGDDNGVGGDDGDDDTDEPPPPPKPMPTHGATKNSPLQLSEPPVTHVVNDGGAVLVDFAYGRGRIAVLSDPFIVSNDGLSRADNLQLAVNLVAGRTGSIAFDEFHHGDISERGDVIAYFRGTPLLVLFGQLFLVVIAILWTGGKRFGRPLPLPTVDRRSSLEFVSSMAELQQRARAFDLAIENIYSRFRRVLVRYSGSTFDLPRNEIAARVSERAGIKSGEVAALMRDCENVINGEGLDEKGAVDLVRRLRDLEFRLGASARQRDIRQAFQG